MREGALAVAVAMKIKIKIKIKIYSYGSKTPNRGVNFSSQRLHRAWQ